jgi:hypothetical protein
MSDRARKPWLDFEKWGPYFGAFSVRDGHLRVELPIVLGAKSSREHDRWIAEDFVRRGVPPPAELVPLLLPSSENVRDAQESPRTLLMAADAEIRKRIGGYASNAERHRATAAVWCRSSSTVAKAETDKQAEACELVDQWLLWARELGVRAGERMILQAYLDALERRAADAGK